MHSKYKPMHKGSSKEDTSNYRTISITSAIEKLLEGIVNTIIMTYLKNNTISLSCHHDSKSSQLVETNLIHTYKYVANIMDQKSPADIIL